MLVALRDIHASGATYSTGQSFVPPVRAPRVAHIGRIPYVISSDEGVEDVLWLPVDRHEPALVIQRVNGRDKAAVLRSRVRDSFAGHTYEVAHELVAER